VAGEDRRTSVRRTTVAEAAELLGISAEAVRGRIRRGTLPVEREGGTVYVLVDEPEPGRTTADRSRTIADQPDALIGALERQVEDLREQVRAERQAHAEARRIIAGLVERIPAIEAPEDASESPESHVPSDTPPDAGGEAQEATERPEQRSWWRRMFGG
jgi:hypothetical protein